MSHLATTVPRKTAPRLAKPAARYWKGKAPKGAAEPQSDSDDEEDEQPALEEDGDVLISGEQDFGAGEEDEDEDEGMRIPAPLKQVKAMNVALKDVNISMDGKVIVAGREESGKTAMEDEPSSEEESEDEEAKPRVPGQSDEESSEYESSEEEEDAPKPQFRPVFVPKRGRATIAEREREALDSADFLARKEAEAEERKKQSHDLVAESIRRELAEKEKEEIIPDVDDADGLDPEAEFEAWRLRELARIKRDKEAELAREEEREEVERRRALPEAQRLQEDLEHAQASRDAKPKGQQKFLQKYWHKGAFRQDEEILTRHDYTEATTSTVDVSMLPKVMQVKNFGKRSRTKYTHLVDQDTTDSTFGRELKPGGAGASAGCFMCGGPHLKKDCPQNLNLPPGQRPVTGANGAGAGARDSGWGAHNEVRDDWKNPEQDGGWKGRSRRDDDEGRRDNRDGAKDRRPDDRDDRRRVDDRDRRDKDERRYGRSRSRSPPRRERRDDDRRRGERRRSRERSVDYARDRGEKRRRYD